VTVAAERFHDDDLERAEAKVTIFSEVVRTREEANKIAKNVKRRFEQVAILRWSNGIDCLINLRR
jgi:hypothetical protein